MRKNESTLAVASYGFQKAGKGLSVRCLKERVAKKRPTFTVSHDSGTHDITARWQLLLLSIAVNKTVLLWA